jgi:hypothetical protein
MIDGSDATPSLPKDSFFLTTVLNVARGYQAVSKTIRDLEDLDLDQYPCIFLLNVAQFGEKALKRLEDYVSRGGRLALFVGDKVRASYYNEFLYKNGQGLLPVPLEPRPTERIDPDQVRERLFEDQYQIYIRDPSHPIFQEAAQPKYREMFKFLTINQYWPTLPRFQWNTDPNRFRELVTLPNRKAVDQYRARAAELNNQLPVNDDKYAKFKPTLEMYQRRIRDALAGEYLYPLGNALESFLNDRGDPNDFTKKPDLVKDFWPENLRLRADLNALRETVQYGDPLVLAHRFGKGQTVLFLTTAGRGWNDWAGGCPASWTYPMIMLDLQKFLTGVGDESNYLVGTPLEVQVDATRYEPKARCFFQAPPKDGEAKPAPAQETGPQDLGDVPGKVEGTVLTFTFSGTRNPGLYFLQLQPKPESGMEPPRPEERAYVFNIDTEAEGNLKRAPRESLERGSSVGLDRAGVTLVTPDMLLRELVAPKRKDMSESPWLYLVILVILIVEQALAVHLSFHLKGAEGLGPEPTGKGSPVKTTEAAA